MTAKVIAAIVAALGLGFAGTYFATGSTGGGCSDGSCPISRLLGLSQSSQSDCCSPASECCDPPSPCCSSGKMAATKVNCCSPAQACCETGEACCKDSDAAKAKTQPVSTPDK